MPHTNINETMKHIADIKANCKKLPDLALLMRHQSRNTYAEDADENIIGLNLCESGLTGDFLPLLAKLPHLQALNLSGNAFTSVDLSGEPSALRFVDFSDCGALRRLHLPAEAPDLERLDVSDAVLEELVLPKSLPQLSYLDASRNKLTTLALPSTLPTLAWMDLSGNDIKDLALPTLPDKFQHLYLGATALSGVPEEIYKEKTNSAEALKAYFRAADQSGEVLNAEAKFVFFGNGRAGKTTLSKQLREGVFENHDPTHGILVWEWEIEQGEFPANLWEKIGQQIEKYQAAKGKTLQTPTKILLNVWDFGGQEYFHATHRLFLNSNVLYTVVWETATDRQDEAAGDFPREYWANNIAHHAPEHILLYVQNKAAGSAAFDFSKQEYKVAYRDSQNKRSEQQYDIDVASLKDGILQQLPNLSYVAVPIAKIYDDIRTEVKKMKAGKNFLTFMEFEALCRRMDKTEDRIMQDDEQIRQVVDFLHDTGCLICYRFRKDKKSDKLDDYVFINPRWVTDVIYKILDEKTLEGNGEFDKKRVVSVLEAEQNTLLDANLWIDLMKEFELVFSKKDSDNQFVAPQYLPSTCKDLSERAFANLLERLPQILVLHYPDFLPRSLISRFICHYGNLAKDYYWKYGIVVHQNREEACVICDYRQQNISIHSATRFSELALELMDTLRSIDDAASLELAVSDVHDPAQMVGPVPFAKLQERCSKGKDDVEWKGQTFELEYFEGLFKRENAEKHSDRGASDRSIGLDFPETSYGPAEMIEVPMAADARPSLSFAQIKGKIDLLYLAATPMRQSQLNTGRESRFKDLIKYFDEEKRFQLHEQHGITREQFQHFVLHTRPHIVHYGGHGDKEGIALEDGSLKAPVLARILKLAPNTQCVVLNACNSLPIALEIAKFVPYVIATRFKIADDTAIEFARGFYQALASGYSVEAAFEAGVLAVQGKDLPNPEVLVLVKGVKPTNHIPVLAPLPVPATAAVVAAPTVPSTIQTNMAKKAFFSYSQHDRAYLDAFLKHLSSLRRSGKIQAWDDNNLKGGEEWDAAIKQNLATADLILLLLSPDFLNTDYIWDVEIKTAMERHERGEAIVVPIVLRPCDWKDLVFGKLNALPSKGTPISSYTDQDTAWLEVVNRIKALFA